MGLPGIEGRTLSNLRFTIASLLGVVLVAAVGTAALRAATDLWDSVLFSATILALLAAVLLAVHRRGLRRAYWLGFAIFGAAYLVASVIPPVACRLLTTTALSALGSKVLAINGAGMAVADVDNDGSIDLFVTNALGRSVLYRNQGNGTFQDVTSSGLVSSVLRPLMAAPGGSQENFVRIGHTLVALVVAFLGGQLSRRLCLSDDRSQAPADVPR